MIKSPYRRRSINLDDGSHERCKILADDMSLSISGFLRVLINETFMRRTGKTREDSRFCGVQQ
jgi:hypothetical protein